MTSQKRYRHHQENHNNRYRDLPPRFKRQKSSSSPPPPAPVTSPDSILQEISSPTSKCNKLSVDNTTPCALYFPHSERVESIEPISPGKASASTIDPLKWSTLTRKDVPVLSTVDNQYYNITPIIHVPLGTQFGYSPPLSPWNQANATTISAYQGQPNSLCKSDPWSQTSGESYISQRLHSPATLNFNNENHVPMHNKVQQLSPPLQWSKSSNIPVHTPPISLQQNEKKNQNSGKNTPAKQGIDYSDPDIRTIEMLRELERVADEKQNDDFGVDRKSLVSHHLRMLMCAVDRYTEGIDDDVYKDEVASNTDSSHTVKQDSLVSEMWPKDHSMLLSEDSSPTKLHPWTNKILSAGQGQQSMLASESPLKSSPSNTWDLWSSPTFDICDFFLSQPLPCSVSDSELPHFDLFGSCQRGDDIEEIKPRKPLYKR
uniref:Uncharacterized protein n=1 Tax=Biomphalaria glabrata TaxID=6526 RepID=A0A2C9LM58_BIOGL